ncbi:DUF3971 domain-containing protein [Azospirillum sp. SYSU D00513]|uniref:YhdP family protein n=1 Tax=Azospirillum sp. SYSU D00513 TaxID=2812561 RepID=UPI001B3B5EF9|nr:DUF3971 domain-containing protein [Azospirillum sp. SYSU D00513]
MRRLGRVLAWAGFALAGLTALAVLALGLLTARLAHGPLSLDVLAPTLEDALSDRRGRFRIELGDLHLSWEEAEAFGGWSRLDLRATRVRAVNADGAELAAVPELGLSLSVGALARGMLSPTRLELVRPRVEVIRRADGRVAFDIRAEDDPATLKRQAAEGDGDGNALIDELLDTLLQPPDMNRQLGLLSRVSVVGGELTVVNRMLGLSWHADPADIVLTRGAEGVVGRARLALDTAGLRATADATIVFRQSDRTASVSASVENLEPAALARLGPALEPLAAVALPISGTVTADLDRRFQPLRVGFDLRGHPGSLSVPALRPEPYTVSGLTARGSLDVGGKRLALERLAIGLGRPGTQAAAALSAAGTLAEEPDGRMAGTGRLELATGGRTAVLELDGRRDERRVTELTARLEELEPALLAGLAPALESLEVAALPLSGTARLVLEPDLMPRAGRIDLSAGAGRVLQPGLFPEPLHIASARLRASGDRAAGAVTVEELAVDLGGPRIDATAQAARTDGRLSVETVATARNLPIEELHRYWPLTAGPGARKWVTSKLSKGIATQATATVRASAPMDGPDSLPGPLAIDHFDARIRAEGMTVDYFHPLPPVEEVSADIVTDGATFTIQPESGRIEDVEVGEGAIVLSGLDNDQERIDIRLPVRGPVPTILRVLDSPPLRYPSKLDIDPKRTKGTADAELHFTFPLVSDLDMDQIQLGVTGRLRGTAVEDVAAGLDATEGELTLALDSEAMNIKGRAKLDGVPVVLDWRERFGDGPEGARNKGPRTRVAVKGELDAADLRSHGIDLGDHLLGPLGADVLFTVDQNRRLALAAKLDLTKTHLSLPLIGWNKPPGMAGKGDLALEFSKGRVTRVTGLTVEGAGLAGEATVIMAPSGTAVSKVRVHRLKHGATELEADITVREGNGYAGSITGRSLDGRHLFGGGKDDGGQGDKDGDGQIPLDLTLRLDRVVFGVGRQLADVTGTIRRNPKAWTALDVNALTGPNGMLTVRYARGADGAYDAAIYANDAGGMLRALDVSDRMRGGNLTITGRTLEPRADAAIQGSVRLDNYTLIDPPALARLLNATAPKGLAELVEGGNEINFGRLVGNFRKDGPALTLTDVRTSGSALGLTMEGEVDIPSMTGNLRGTIVPLYGLNRLIGQIPILGDIISGGEGQGIFSATWHARGPLGEPDISVNPLAVLAPGFLRNLFFLGDGPGSGGGAPSGPPPDPVGGR